MALIYKDATLVSVVNTVVETSLFSFDFDRHAQLSGGLPMGSNQAARITCFGEFLETSGTTTPNAYFRFKFGDLQADEIVYIDSAQWFKASFDLVLIPHNKLLYCPVYLVGDNGAEPGDNRVGIITTTTAFDISPPLVAELTVQLSSAHANLRAHLHGFYVEVL